MAQSNGFNLGQLLGPRSVIQADQLAADAGAAGVTTYTSIGDLPSSGLTSGDMAFVDSSDRLYIWTGAGWYNIAVVNQTPAIQSILDSDGLSSPFVLSNEGATTTITMIAADPDGFPVSYIAVADSDFNAMATLSQVSNVFTITPTAIENSTGTITFKASDGINLASEISTFTLVFSIPDPDFNSVSFLSNFNGADNGVNNTFIDGSTSAHAITANGNVTQGSFGPFARPDGEWAVSFDGAGDYLTVPDSEDFNMGSENFTAECWVFPTASPSQPIIMGQWSGSYSWAIQFSNNSSRYLRFITNAGSMVDQVSSTAVPLNQWSHVALVRNGTSFVAYLNGTSAVSSTVSGSLTNSTNALSIGGGVGGAQPYQGSISNVRITKGTAVYTSAFTPPTAPLTALTNTKLLICQSNRFVDNSASAHTITPGGNAAVTPSSPFATAEVYDHAVNGASGYFDGTGDYLSTTNTNIGNFGTANFTIEFWLYSQGSLAAFGMPISAYNADNAASHWSIQLDRDVDGNIYWYNSINLGINSSIKLVNNQWTHLAVVRNGGTTTMYVNGLSGGSFSDSTNYVTPSGLVIGSDLANPQSWEFNGYLSNLRIVKGTAVYTSAFTSPTAPLTAITNTTLLLNMNNGKAIDGTAKNNLTLRGNVKLSSTQSKFGGTSLFFDGTFAGDYVTAPDNSYYAMGTGNFTIECWIYLTGAAAYSMIFEQGSTVSDISFGLKPTTLQPYLYAGGFVINGSSNAQLNVWQHIALVRNSGTITIYLNGISIGSTSTVYNYTSQKFMIGATAALTNFIKGYIDDFRISKTARYTSNFTPPTEPFPDLG